MLAAMRFASSPANQSSGFLRYCCGPLAAGAAPVARIKRVRSVENALCLSAKLDAILLLLRTSRSGRRNTACQPVALWRPGFAAIIGYPGFAAITRGFKMSALRAEDKRGDRAGFSPQGVPFIAPGD